MTRLSAARRWRRRAAASSPFPLSRAIRPVRFSKRFGKASQKILGYKGGAPRARIPDRPSMLLPAARESLEALLRHPSMEGALGELSATAVVVSITGRHDV